MSTTIPANLENSFIKPTGLEKFGTFNPENKCQESQTIYNCIHLILAMQCVEQGRASRMSNELRIQDEFERSEIEIKYNIRSLENWGFRKHSLY